MLKINIHIIITGIFIAYFLYKIIKTHKAQALSYVMGELSGSSRFIKPINVAIDREKYTM